MLDRFVTSDSPSRSIYYSDFLQAVIDTSFMTDQKNIQALFDHFDTDNTGYITKENLMEIFARQGSQISQGELEHMLDDYDILQDKRISIEEFKRMMKYEYEPDQVEKEKKLRQIHQFRTATLENIDRNN